jgi:hypothetical protein
MVRRCLNEFAPPRQLNRSVASVLSYMTIPKPIWIGLIIGIAIGAVLFVLSFLTAFGICSDTSIAEKCFPFALIVDPSLLRRPLLAFVLALLQYPLYGTVLGIGWVQAGRRKSLYVASIILVLTVHIAGVTFATKRVEAMWQQRLSHLNP